MASDFSRDSLLDFLDYLANKGLMNKSTVVSRKAAVNTLLSILAEEEASDLRNLNLDDLVIRFSSLKGSDFKPESLRVYKSRLNSVLEDFNRYKRDPLSFRPKVTQKERPERAGRALEKDRASSGRTEEKAADRTGKINFAVSDETQSIVFPIPIRPGVIVKVAGIPSDLTPEEAQKIGNVILALSGSQEE